MPNDKPAPRAAHALTNAQTFMRQIVYGGNDGIITTFAVVAGFAGAGSGGIAEVGALAVLVFGLANLFADGVSMGLGEFLSSRSQRDVWHAQRDRQLREIETKKGQETAQLAWLLRARGVSETDADELAALMIRNPGLAADFVLTDEMGLSDPDGGDAAAQALATFLSFLAFGFVPILPYVLFDATETTFLLSVAATFSALSALGLLRWQASGERPGRALGETLGVGGLCALVAYCVGMLVGG